ncbi:hypothetical protein MVEN_02269800 [Mycena venus]|uniref:Uncharacterized protein n=1 Tax=Mycena venus TaxID=2733690 RepID=A0A8H7CFE2_9AGAR|nr:hypothetical protein MVEN_02269800 [Mycena venus]
MAATYLKFDKHSVRNSKLVSKDSTVKYTINTVTGRPGKWKPTVVHASGGLAGSIDWPGGMFTIGGVERSIEGVAGPSTGLVKRTGGEFKKEWAWSETRYTVRYLDGEDQWTVRPTLGFTEVARLEAWDKTPPTILMSSELQDETERMFLLLVFIYCKKLGSGKLGSGE